MYSGISIGYIAMYLQYVVLVDVVDIVDIVGHVNRLLRMDKGVWLGWLVECGLFGFAVSEVFIPST